MRRQRGHLPTYIVASMKEPIPLGDDRYRCPNCGRVIKTKSLPIYCACRPSRGLGDTVAKITSAVGIRPCGGCKKRQKKLNELFPYKAQ